MVEFADCFADADWGMKTAEENALVAKTVKRIAWGMLRRSGPINVASGEVILWIFNITGDWPTEETKEKVRAYLAFRAQRPAPAIRSVESASELEPQQGLPALQRG